MNESTSLILGQRHSTWAASVLSVILGSVVVAICSQIGFHLPFTPVPVTGQTLGVLLVSATLGRKRGTAALALYVFEGLCGFPVFALGGFGPMVLFGPRGGFLIGFIAAAYCVGSFFDREIGRDWATALSALVFGQLVIYALGASWLAVFVGGEGALRAGVAPFLLGDAIKIAIAASALKLLPRMKG